VSGQIERERLLEADDCRERIGPACFLELFERPVRAGDIRRVVLVMVELDDLTEM
jgi:hypothetical protein